MNSAGQSLLNWLGAMTLATGAVLLLALIADRALERRVSAAVRLLLYVAVLARLALPAGWTSPLGLLGGWRPAEAPANIEVGAVAVEIVAIEAPPPTFAVGTILLGVWLAVSLVLLVFWTYSRVRLQRQLRATVAAGNSESGIPVLQHPVLGPLVAGAWRPRIVVPEALVAASDREPLRWVLRHESAHAQRRDPLLSSAVQVICLLAWPVVPIWIAARRIRTLMEIACDERAVAHEDGAGRRRYGEVLLSLAAGAPGRSSPAGALSFTSPLRGRLRALVPRRRWPAVVQAAVVVALGALAVACAGEPGIDDGAVEVGGGDASDASAEVSTSALSDGLGVPALSMRPEMQSPVRRFGVIGSTTDVPGYLGLNLAKQEWRDSLARSGVAPSRSPLAGKDPATDRIPPPASGELAPVVSVWHDGSAWVYTKRGGSRRLHYRHDQQAGASQVGVALTGELRAALAESGARSVLVHADRSIPLAQMAPLLSAAKRAGAQDHAIVAPIHDRRVGKTMRPRPPILTVSDKGRLFLENRVITLDQLEEHLRYELWWRKQDTLLIRGDKADMLKSVDVMAIAKRAGAAQIGILANDGSSPAPAPSTPVASTPAPARDMAEAMNVVKAKGHDVKGCYEQALRRGQVSSSGRAEIRLGIDAEGRVSREEVVFHELGDAAFKNCLVEKMRTWRFPKASRPSEVAFPLLFQGSEPGRTTPLSSIPLKTPPASPSSSGEIDPAIVAKQIRERMPDVRRCYEAALARAPKLSGRMELTFTIDADGRVSRPSLALSTLNDARVENCVVELAGTWTFLPPEGGPAEVSFPFVFSTNSD